ncbi:MAG: RES domain-containing protein [Acidobacteriota bacterium]|nr:RES domain-containing protein [Acidobacteriota bacterium]
MIGFRQADPRYPFLWSDSGQPAARWHADGEGPAHYFADTPDGAWAELLRHEEIHDPADVATFRRVLWAVELSEDEPAQAVMLKLAVATGNQDSYWACQEHARKLRERGATRLVAPTAALVPGGAAGREVVDALERPATPRDGRVIVIFGEPAGLLGWKAVEHGAPPAGLLQRVRHFGS